MMRLTRFALPIVLMAIHASNVHAQQPPPPRGAISFDAPFPVSNNGSVIGAGQIQLADNTWQVQSVTLVVISVNGGEKTTGKATPKMGQLGVLGVWNDGGNPPQSDQGDPSGGWPTERVRRDGDY